MSRGFKFLGERPDDIFEAITIIAKRARQINQKRADKFTLKPYQVDGEEELQTEEAYDPEIFEGMEKPTTMAMREFEESKIEYEYRENSEDKDVVSPSADEDIY